MDDNANIQNLLKNAQTRLVEISDSPRLDAQLLLVHALNKSRSYLYAWPERIPEANQTHYFSELLERRLAGEPVAYILERREFWSLDLRITPATLIPRPETELLVELALEHIPLKHSTRIADLGTGSGAIALAIASERPQAQIIATDNHQEALALAAANAHRLDLDQVEFRRGDWCTSLPNEHFSVIISNPPYLAGDDPHLDQGDLRFEPPDALTDGSSGLTAIALIIHQALKHLLPGGWLLLEHGHDQSESVRALLLQHGYTAITTHHDLAGIERVSMGQRPNA